MSTPVSDLTIEAQGQLLQSIVDGLASFPGSREDILEMIVEYLDDADGDDAYGTEGWRHTFGIDD